MNVDIFINDDRELDVIVCGKGSQQHILALTWETLFIFYVQVIAADAAARKMDITHVWKVPPQIGDDAGFTGNASEHEMLKTAADNCVKQRPLAVRYKIDRNHMPLRRLAIILRKLPEWPL